MQELPTYIMPDVKSGIFSALREQGIVCDDTVGLKYPGNSPECSTGSTGRQAKRRRKGQADLTDAGRHFKNCAKDCRDGLRNPCGAA